MPNAEKATLSAEVICRDHQAYLPNDALAGRARGVAAVFAAAEIRAIISAYPAATNGPEHYPRGAAPWLVEACLPFAQLPWFRAGLVSGAAPDAARQLARLCWGVAAAARRLRTPAGALTLVDPALPLLLELPYELSAEDFAALVTGALASQTTGALRWRQGEWKHSAS